MAWHGDKNGNMPKLLNCTFRNKHNPSGRRGAIARGWFGREVAMGGGGWHLRDISLSSCAEWARETSRGGRPGRFLDSGRIEEEEEEEERRQVLRLWADRKDGRTAVPPGLRCGALTEVTDVPRNADFWLNLLQRHLNRRVKCFTLFGLCCWAVNVLEVT